MDPWCIDKDQLCVIRRVDPWILLRVVCALSLMIAIFVLRLDLVVLISQHLAARRSQRSLICVLSLLFPFILWFWCASEELQQFWQEDDRCDD